MVLSARFELATSWFEARRSIQMSYESIKLCLSPLGYLLIFALITFFLL